MDEQVDKEQAWKKSSKCNGHVSTELNLKGNSVGGEGLDDVVQGEGRGGQSSNWQGSGSLGDGGLGDCGSGSNNQEGETES